MSRSHYAYAEPDINRTKIESFFDNDPSLVELDEYLEKNCAYGCKYFVLKKLVEK